jgi:branched-chain amino acid transport system substrate-binding protein
VRSLALLLPALACAVVVAGTVSAAPSTEPGVTRTSVLIGGTVPLQGEAAAGGNTARGAKAYFDYLNARGGVRGRRINYKFVNDDYDPAKTVQATRELIQQDRVFAIFNSLGTAHNVAIRPFLNAGRVPHLFVASGATTWGRDWRRYPWTIGFIPSYNGEGKIYARHILRTRRSARIGILYQDDEYGRDLVAAFERGLGARRRQIVAKQSYSADDTDVASEIARLRSSGANTLMVFAFGKFAIQAFVFVKRLGWRPQIYLNAVAASTSVLLIASGSGQTQGAFSIAFFKDPADPRWRRDRGYRLFLQIMRRYLPNDSLKDGYFMAGMAAAYTMAETLRKAGRTPTRAGVLRTAANLNIRNNPFVLPGIPIKTGPRDRFPIEYAQLQRWRNGRWRPVGKLVSAPRG